MEAFKKDLRTCRDETWTKKDVLEGLKLISEFTGVASLGIAAGLGVIAVTGGLGLPFGTPLAVYSMAGVFRAYEEATPRQKFCMRAAGRFLTGRILF